MRNPYLAVASTYAASWSVRITGVLLAFFLLISPIHVTGLVLSVWPMIPVLVVTIFFLVAISNATQLLFAAPAALLTPNFAKYHLTVAGVLVAMLWLTVSGVLAAETSVSFIALASAVFAVFALVGWSACTVFALILLPPLVLVCLDNWESKLGSFLRGELPLVSAMLFAAGVGSFIIFGRILRRLARDLSGHKLSTLWRRDPTGSTQSAPVDVERDRRFSRHWLVRRRGERLEKFLTTPVAGLWREAQRLRMAACAGVSARWMAILFVIIGLSDFVHFQGKDFQRYALKHALFFLFTLAALALARSAWQYRTLLGQEALRPVTRGRLFVQIGFAFLCDVVKTWITVATVVLVMGVIAVPALVTDPQTWRGMAMAFCAIPLAFAVGTLLLLLRYEGLASILYLAVFLLGWNAVYGVDVFTVWAVIAVAGVMLSAIAYSAWLGADLA